MVGSTKISVFEVRRSSLMTSSTIGGEANVTYLSPFLEGTARK